MAKSNAHRIAAIETLISNMGSGTSVNAYSPKFAEVGNQFMSAVKALRDLDHTPNPDESEGAHDSRLASAAQKLSNRITDLEGRMFRLLKSEQEDIDEAIQTKVNLRPDEKYGAELRAVFRASPHTKQEEMLKQFAVANDGPSLAAICCSPAVLSGATTEMQGRYKTYIQSMHAPAEVAQSKALLKAMQPVLSVARVARDFASDFGSVSAGDPAKEAAVAKDRDAAAAAMAAFDEQTN